MEASERSLESKTNELAALQSVLAGLDIQARAAVQQNSDNGLQDYLIELRSSADIQVGGQP